MGLSILPSGQDISTTPESILKYLDSNGLRQLLRQERIRWNLKVNRDSEYYSNQTLFKYGGDLHNETIYQRMEIRTFPDNGAYGGFAGIHVDSGESGIIHNLEKWDHSISSESLSKVVNRVQFGAMARIPNKIGYGLDESDQITRNTTNRQAAMLADPYDGRIYLYTNDDPNYANNENRPDKIPLRAIARVGDIPTRISDLNNDLSFISDPDYNHTDNNFTTSNRYILDNIDDRTFVYPEISKNSSGDYIENIHTNLKGDFSYGESDGDRRYNSQPDPFDDRRDCAIYSYNANKRYSGVEHLDGYLPGIFRSLEELEKVDLVDQKRTLLTNNESPGNRRPYNWYTFDGQFSANWFNRMIYINSYLAQSLHPNNMELAFPNRQPIPFNQLLQTTPNFNTTRLYQWRYNRITLRYYTRNITMTIVESGHGYREGDIIRYNFGDEVLFYTITAVGANGQIIRGTYLDRVENNVLYQDPSTNGVGVPFSTASGTGRGAKLSIKCPVTVQTNATQIKNNLYAYVNVVPCVRSDNTSLWSDVNPPDTQDGLVNIRSTAAGPAYSGINSGRGGPSPNPNTSQTRFHEHGGNATAGIRVHLFRYVINTQNPSWVIRDGIQVFTGKWVDQGPIGGSLRPADIKALLFSNFDTNNFNCYYKFNLDLILDNMNRVPDAVTSNNPTALSQAYIHKAQRDPLPEQRFTTERVNSETSKIELVDITDKVIYINGATGVTFVYNSSNKNDPNYGYGYKPIGWIALAGSVSV